MAAIAATTTASISQTSQDMTACYRTGAQGSAWRLLIWLPAAHSDLPEPPPTRLMNDWDDARHRKGPPFGVRNLISERPTVLVVNASRARDQESGDFRDHEGGRSECRV